MLLILCPRRCCCCSVIKILHLLLFPLAASLSLLLAFLVHTYIHKDKRKKTTTEQRKRSRKSTTSMLTTSTSSFAVSCIKTCSLEFSNKSINADNTVPGGRQRGGGWVEWRRRPRGAYGTQLAASTDRGADRQIAARISQRLCILKIAAAFFLRLWKILVVA